MIPVRPAGTWLRAIVVGPGIITGEETCGAGVFGGCPPMMEFIIAPRDVTADCGGVLLPGELDAAGLAAGGLEAGGGAGFDCGDGEGFGYGLGGFGDGIEIGFGGS